jgi:hypothetical protein
VARELQVRMNRLGLPRSRPSQQRPSSSARLSINKIAI